jgi:cation transport ATPase
LDFYSKSDQQVEKVNDEGFKEREYPTRQETEKVNDEGYKEREYPTRQETEREMEERGCKQWFMGLKKKKTDEEDQAEVYSPSRSRSKSSKKKKKVEMFWVKLVLKILVVIAVCYNFKFLLNFMNDPISTFYHTLFVVGMCVGINFIAVWILFYKNSFIRFYLSLFAILGSFVYYFYVTYTNQSIFGHNLITSVLVIISVLMAINPKVNYYMKSFAFLLIPIVGIYLSNNKFALVWTLMFNAGLILFFRVVKSNKKQARTRRNQMQRNQKQSA